MKSTLGWDNIHDVSSGLNFIIWKRAMKWPAQNKYSKIFYLIPFWLISPLLILLSNNLGMHMWSCILSLLLLNPNILISIHATPLFESSWLLLISSRVNSKPLTFKAIWVLTPGYLFCVFPLEAIFPASVYSFNLPASLGSQFCVYFPS